MDRIEQHNRDEYEGPVEIALVGDLTDNEAELTDRLLGVPPNGECTLFIDSPGGSPYCAIALTTLIRLRGIRATGIVTGECSSATLWPFAACQRRIVTPFSVLLFHPMKWQSEEHVGLQEAAEVPGVDGLEELVVGAAVGFEQRDNGLGIHLRADEIAEVPAEELLEGNDAVPVGVQF